MSFAGNNGSAGVTAHKHTSAAGDGGSLDNTTLIQNMKLYSVIMAV